MTAFTPDAAAALPGPAWLRSARAAAAERFGEQPWPTVKEDVWRYSRIDELDLDRFSPLAPGERPLPAGVPDAVAPIVEAAGSAAAVVVVCNGSVSHVAVNHPRLRVETLDDGAGASGGTGVLRAREADVFVTLNAGFMPDAVVISAPDGELVEEPVVIVHWIDAGGAGVFPRTVIDAGEQSQLTVVEHVASADVECLVAPVVELHAGAAANVRYLNIQDLGPRVWQLAYATSDVARDANLEAASVALGGDYARLRTDAEVAGQGATSNLMAVYFGDGTQMHDFRTLQDHVGPRTTSDLLFKGAVADHARAVYTGLIRVRQGARGTNAFQTNRNLVLSEGAHAESVPNLEILENDVRCSHASAIGPIDEDQRYYLESRGVPPEVAGRLIVMGFFGEVIDHTGVAPLRPLLRQAIAEKLGRVRHDVAGAVL